MSSGLNFDVKDRIKHSTNIVEWIGSDLQLRRQGSVFVGHCPWHDDSRPSFQVNPAKQSWVCWPCELRGDIFDYVMRRESVDFRQAMVILAEHAGIPMNDYQKKVAKGSPDDKQTLYKAMAWAEAVYHDCLMSSAEAIPVRNYLAERGMTDEVIETFKLGFAPLSWSWLVDRARSTDFSPAILEACGLIKPNERGNWYEHFRGRVIFPIRDTQQRPIALGGRVVPGIYGSEAEPRGKYVNSMETRLFSKSENLFGLDLFVRDPVARERKLTIVEGYTDVIAAYQSGLRNVVAALGTAINEKHIRLTRRFADQITLVLDGDDAGQKRSNQILDLFVAQDTDLRILTLPEGQDPFDFCRQNGAEPFQALVDAAPDAMSHKIRHETRGIDLVNDTHAANQALESILKTMGNVSATKIAQSPTLGLRQDQLVTRLSRQFQIDRVRIRSRLNELRMAIRTPLGSPGTASEARKIDSSKWDRKEVELIQILIQAPELLDFSIENVPPSLFAEGPLRQIYEHMEESFHIGGDVSYGQLMLDMEDVQLKSIVDRLYDEAISKQQMLLKGERRDFELPQQFDAVVQSFHELANDSSYRTTLSQLQQRQLDEGDEASALENLLKQTRQRQGLVPPMDGQQPR
jgi:DNA primase